MKQISALIITVLVCSGCLLFLAKALSDPSEPSALSLSSTTGQDNPFRQAGQSSGVFIDVPYLSQQGTFPTGCELVSAMMLIKYYDAPVTAQQLLMHTPQENLVQHSDGSLTGPHPDDAFIGDPQTSYGFGCFPPVVKAALSSVLGPDYQVTDLTGSSLQDLASRYLDRHIPLLVWATIDMKQSSCGDTWTIKETGEIFTWRRPEHCLVLVGYNQTHYFFNDPRQEGGKAVSYPRELVEQRFQEMGRRALAVTKAT